MAIQNTLVTTTAADVLTVPAGATYASIAMVMCNYGLSDESVTVYAVPSGSAAGNLTTIMKSFLLPAGNSYVWDTKLILGASDKIQVVGATGGLVSVTTTYMAL